MPEKKRFLTKAEILGQNDLKTEDIQIPEWGDAWVRVRTLNASERDWFEASMIERRGKNVTQNLRNIRARLCLLCLVNPETGDRLFAEEDEFPLGGKNGAALDRIFQVAQRLNGMRDEDVDELAKNSNGDQGADSLSA